MAEQKSPASMTKAKRIDRIELLISWFLRAGVFVSMLAVLLGVILMFAHHPEYLKSAADLKRLTTPGTAFPHTVGDVLLGVLAARGQAIIVFGLLLLIATPIMRVVVAIVAFALQRDYTFALISALVCATLLGSFLLGMVE